MEEIKEQPEVTKKEKKPKTFRRGVLTGVLCSLLVMALILGGWYLPCGAVLHAGRFKPFQVATHFYTGTSLLL